MEESDEEIMETLSEIEDTRGETQIIFSINKED